MSQHTATYNWVMRSNCGKYFPNLRWLVILGFLFPMGALGQLRDSSRTAISVGFVNNINAKKLDFSATLERNLSSRISGLISYGFNPISSPGNAYLWRFTWQFAAHGRYYFTARNRYLMSGAYMGIYACHDRKSFFFDHSTQHRFRIHWTSIGPTIGYQQVLLRKLQLSTGIMVLFYQREVEEFFNRQGDLTRRKNYGPNHSYNYYLSMGFRL